MDYTIHGILQARILDWVAFPFSRGSSQPRDGSNPGLLHCRQILYQLSHKKTLDLVTKDIHLIGIHVSGPWDSLGQNTGLGSLSLLQGIFPNQVSNPGLPHCRQILYHLSHKGSPPYWLSGINIYHSEGHPARAGNTGSIPELGRSHMPRSN